MYTSQELGAEIGDRLMAPVLGTGAVDLLIKVNGKCGRARYPLFYRNLIEDINCYQQRQSTNSESEYRSKLVRAGSVRELF